MSDGISKALNTSFEIEDEIISIDKEMATLNNKTQQYNRDKLELEDKEYIVSELKELIASTKSMKSYLEENLKRPPTKASDVEAYSLILSQLGVFLRELRQLNAEEVKTELARKRITSAPSQTTIGTQNNNLFMLDAKSLSSMVLEARKNSQINAIEATFDTDVK